MGGAFRFSVLMLWFALVEAGRVCATVWLSTWTDTADNPGGAPHPAIWYLSIYAGISGVQARTLGLDPNPNPTLTNSVATDILSLKFQRL